MEWLREWEHPEAVGSLSAADARMLLEDLRLHQTELEAQNEELRQAQEVIEESRERLSDLYDFAPAAYLHLSVNTVRTYRTRILEKIGVKGTSELIHYAITHSLTE